jgi:hypothetical protein
LADALTPILMQPNEARFWNLWLNMARCEGGEIFWLNITKSQERLQPDSTGLASAEGGLLGRSGNDFYSEFEYK